MLIIAVSSILIYVIDNNTIDFIVYVFAIGLALNVYFDENKTRILAVGIWSIFISGILDGISVVMVKMIFQIISYKNELLLELVASIISVIFVYLVGKIIRSKHTYGLRNIKKYSIVLFTILAAIDAIVLIYMQYQATSLLNDMQGMVYRISYIFVVIGIFIQLAAVIILMVSRDEYKEKKLMIEQYLNEQQMHYEYLEQREYETRKFRHDLKSHMHMLHNFLTTREYDKFDEYLELINLKVDDFANRISVNNDIVDAIINKYYAETKKNNVEMKIEGHFPGQCNISAYDLCTIFSNLLSNALEAAGKAERKEITVSCRYNDDDIIIIISNYYSGEVKYVDGRLRTSKHNERIHGFGLENVEECVENNGGYIKISNENNVFSVTILLKNLQEAK